MGAGLGSRSDDRGRGGVSMSSRGREADAPATLGSHHRCDDETRHDVAPPEPSQRVIEGSARGVCGQHRSGARGTGVPANILVPAGSTNTNLLPPNSIRDRTQMLQADVIQAPVRWLASNPLDGSRASEFAQRWDVRTRVCHCKNASRLRARPRRGRFLAAQGIPRRLKAVDLAGRRS